MTALHVVDVGCCCTDDLYSVIQALVDQLVGFQTFASMGAIQPSVGMVLEHSAKVAAIAQNTLNSYAENHGLPDAYHAALAASHVMKSMTA